MIGPLAIKLLHIEIVDGPYSRKQALQLDWLFIELSWRFILKLRLGQVAVVHALQVVVQTLLR